MDRFGEGVTVFAIGTHRRGTGVGNRASTSIGVFSATRQSMVVPLGMHSVVGVSHGDETSPRVMCECNVKDYNVCVGRFPAVFQQQV